jgi:hypothetical protein
MKASKIKLVQKNRIAHVRDQQNNRVMFQRKQEIRINREYPDWSCGLPTKSKIFGV